MNLRILIGAFFLLLGGACLGYGDRPIGSQKKALVDFLVVRGAPDTTPRGKKFIIGTVLIVLGLFILDAKF